VASHGDNHAHVDHPEIYRYERVQLEETMTTIGTPEGIYGRRKMTAYLRRQGNHFTACTSIARPADE
jgi:hypothetical protein